MRKALVILAVAGFLCLAFYFFMQSYSDNRSTTTAMTLPPDAGKGKTAMTLSIVCFSVAVASVFYYLSIQQAGEAVHLRPDKTDAAVSSDDAVARLTSPEQPRRREKERYFVSEDFSEAHNKNRF